jgi:hypothetical protein
MSGSQTGIGSRRTLAVKMPVRSILVLLNTSQKYGKRIMIWPLRSIAATISSRRFWDGSAFTPVKRNAEEVY